MAKARLRRGIELVKLANRIEALKMSEDDPQNPDFPANPEDTASQVGAAIAKPVSASASSPKGGEESSGKGKLTRAMKGAIFREIVLAKVREMKEQEQTNKAKEDIEKEAKHKSFHG